MNPNLPSNFCAARSYRSGGTLPVGELKETFDQIDKLWSDAMDRADQRFKFLSYLLARVIDGSLTIEQVAGLPKGDALLGPFDAPSPQPVAGDVA